MFLANISRISPQFLISDASFVANFCYGIMSQAIRSELDKQLIENCSFIILNLARYEPTKRITFQVRKKKRLFFFSQVSVSIE